nr:acyl carrier protein [Tengunoibacter tsumagoiensis]
MLRDYGVERYFDLDTTLVALGFDSLSTLELVVALEDHFQIAFDDEDLTGDHFQSIGSLLAILNKHVLQKAH